MGQSLTNKARNIYQVKCSRMTGSIRETVLCQFPWLTPPDMDTHWASGQIASNRPSGVGSVGDWHERKQCTPSSPLSKDGVSLWTKPWPATDPFLQTNILLRGLFCVFFQLVIIHTTYLALSCCWLSFVYISKGRQLTYPQLFDGIALPPIHTS